jgi:DNA-binding NarL/FixJ family response regulator
MPSAPHELDALALGRAAVSERRWNDAFRHLSSADSQQPLVASDLGMLAQAAQLSGHDGSVLLERLYTLCLAEGDELGAASAAFWHGFRLASLGERGQSQAWLARSQHIVDRHGDCAERGYLMLPKIHRSLSHGDSSGGYAAALAAREIGERYGDADLCALALQLGGRALIEQGDVDAGVRMLDEAMLVATEAPVSELTRGLVYCAVIGCCQSVFLIDRAREWSDLLDSWCKTQTQLGLFSGTCRVHRAELMRIRGDWTQAFDEAVLVRATAGVNEYDLAAASYEEAEIFRLRGDRDSAERCYERASELGGDPQPGLALLRLATGDIEAAAGGIRRSVLGAKSMLRRARYLPACVEIVLAAGDEAGARAAAVDLGEIAARYGTPVLHAMAEHARGLVASAASEYDTALEALRDALQSWIALGAPYAAAQVRMALAVAYTALGDPDGAKLELGAAQRAIDELETRAHLARADSVSASETPDLLSVREVEVLRLASIGKTNRQIAIELNLSPRTVDRHVSNILAKLVVPSRAAATAYAYEHGLIRS